MMIMQNTGLNITCESRDISFLVQFFHGFTIVTHFQQAKGDVNAFYCINIDIEKENICHFQFLSG